MMLAVFLVVMLCVCAWADDHNDAVTEAARSMRSRGLVQFNIKDMDIVRFARFMSELLSEDIVLSSDINRNSYVSVFTAGPVTLERAREILMKALRNSSFSHYSNSQTEDTGGKNSAYYTRIFDMVVKPAVPNGEEGIIPASTMDYFLRNTAYEMLGIRLRFDRKKDGLIIVWMMSDRFFAEIGLKRNDIIMSVNGGRLSAMDGLQTAINSLMKRERFDIELLRGDERIALKYAVVKYDSNMYTVTYSADKQPLPGNGKISLEEVRASLRNPFDELKKVRLCPDEKTGGLKIQWLQNESLLRRLGVRIGDVIKSVNGIPLMKLEDIAGALDSLMNSPSFDVEIIRGGENKALHYTVK